MPFGCESYVDVRANYRAGTSANVTNAFRL